MFQRVCSGCHGAIHQKYDLLVDKGFKQRELMVISFTLTRSGQNDLLPKAAPSASEVRVYQTISHRYKGDYFQEWDYRQRVIHDRIWPPYFTMH